MHIDHIILAVRDFEAAATRLSEKFGLQARPGGTHPMGTANWSVSLESPQYVELLGVGDEAVMLANPFGRQMLSVLEGGDCLLSWAIGVDDIEEVAARLGRFAIPGEWQAPNGFIGRWRNVFADQNDFAHLPFFIQYDTPAREPSAGVGSISWIEVGGDREKMRQWIGSDELPLRCAGGEPGLHAVAIAMPDREIVIRSADLCRDTLPQTN